MAPKIDKMALLIRLPRQIGLQKNKPQDILHFYKTLAGNEYKIFRNIEKIQWKKEEGKNCNIQFYKSSESNEFSKVAYWESYQLTKGALIISKLPQ